ncbi:MAG: metallophosphoesterase [Coleofasciculus sp. B1-GNL1-01]|uniref:metallophosphoesterase n=1 Tax=Coleofasciculus sp. B1-GNL1-01 TaxID=3068484 RepID=UPI00330182B8
MSKWLTRIGTQSIDMSYLTKNSIYSLHHQGEVSFESRSFYLFLGDLHGNIKAAIALAIRLQTLFKIPLRAIFQVGDFGFWPSGIAAKNEDPHYKKEDAFDFYEMAESANQQKFFSLGTDDWNTLNAPFYFIRGNHEDFNHLNLISKPIPSEVIRGIFFIPDYFHGVIEDLHIMALGGILTDLERGKGKRAKIEFKKSQRKLKIDRRRSNASLLVQLNSIGVDLLLTHSGLASRENQDGSKQLENYLIPSDIRLHFYGHHHRFSIGTIGVNSLSIGLRNLDVDARGILRPGSFALVAWNDRNNFEIYSDTGVTA